MIQRKIQEKPKEHQPFHFKSLFWSVINVMQLAMVTALIAGLYHIVSFGLTWNSEDQYLYYAVIVYVSVSTVWETSMSLLIVHRAYDEGKLIELPRLFLSKTCNLELQRSFFQKCVIAVGQFIAVVTILQAAFALSVYGCGIVIAILVSPVQVLSRAIFYAAVGLCFIMLGTYMYEYYEKCDEESWRCCCSGQLEWLEDLAERLAERIKRAATYSCVWNLCCSGQHTIKFKFSNVYCTLFFQLLIISGFLAFSILFGVTYLNIILFVGPDQTGVVSGLAQLLPALLITFIGWLIKKEYDKFSESTSEDENN